MPYKNKYFMRLDYENELLHHTSVSKWELKIITKWIWDKDLLNKNYYWKMKRRIIPELLKESIGDNSS